MEHVEYNKCKLTKCEVTIDPEGEKYPRMHLQYLVETEYETRLIDIPEAILPLKPNFIVTEISEAKSNISMVPSKEYRLILSENKCYLEEAYGEFSDKKPYAYAEKIIERRAKKVTVKEIEEKLGYPIEIVSEKE